MSRILSYLLLGLLLVTTSHSGEAEASGPHTRAAILASVNAEFLRVQPCGVAEGPSRYQIDHLAVAEDWACIAGDARCHGHSGPFEVNFIALLKWNCGGWNVSTISFNPDELTRRRFIGLRQVPSDILPQWIRWSR
jgi:hypothetical protein